MSDDRPFARSIGRLYERVASHFGDDRAASRIVIASFDSDAQGSVVTLSLAHAACEDGQRVLVIDCDGGDPALSNCVSEQNGAPWPARRRSPARDLDDESGLGEVVVVPLDRGGRLDEELDRLSQYDLVLLYCGSIASAAGVINRWKAADALVVVAEGREVDADLEDKLVAARLEDRCIGVVLTSDEERARKRA
jgi:hypothetical protein